MQPIDELRIGKITIAANTVTYIDSGSQAKA